MTSTPADGSTDVGVDRTALDELAVRTDNTVEPDDDAADEDPS